MEENVNIIILYRSNCASKNIIRADHSEVNVIYTFTILTYIEALFAFNFFILDVETVTMEFVVNIKQGHSSISHKHYEMCVNEKVDQHLSSESRFQEKLINL